jgi:hypothetical protein
MSNDGDHTLDADPEEIEGLGEEGRGPGARDRPDTEPETFATLWQRHCAVIAATLDRAHPSGTDG